MLRIFFRLYIDCFLLAYIKAPKVSRGDQLVTVHGSDNVYGKARRRMAFTKPNVEAGLSK